MENIINYRQVEDFDALAIVTVDQSRYSAEKAFSFDYILSCWRLHKDTFFIALDGDRIVGFSIGLSSKSNEMGWISAVTVLKEYEGRKIGTQLVNQVCDKLNLFGCTSVGLTCKQDLVSYYERLGFARISDEIRNYYGKGEHRYILNKQF